MNTEVLASPPSIPSKWDCIPIHGSDIAAYKQCRRRWDWSSPARNNLRRKVSIFGINFPLWFGTGIHYALEMFYDPILRRDPVESFQTWFEFQWNGGVVGEGWLDRLYDVHPHLIPASYEKGRTEDGGYYHKATPELYKVRGLKDLLPNIELVQEEVDAHRDLGIGMMTFYKDYAERNDDFVVVAAESSFSIPLGFESLDIREDSPNYGKSLEVHARGKRDAVIYFPEMDKYGVIDHKTVGRLDDDYFIKLEKDEQVSNYLWATMQEAKMHGYPWGGKMVDRVIYNAIRKNYPKPPTITTRGFPSLDRQKEGTTAELFQEAVLGNENLETWFRTDPKAQAYYSYLCETGDSMFVQRDVRTRNAAEVKNTGLHLQMVAKEMLSDPAIYPSPSNAWTCLHCPFRSPCIAADDGSDHIGMLEDGYEVNRGR